MSGRLNGKVAIVTGGAGPIGSAIAKAYAAEGAQVVVADKCAVDGVDFVETDMKDREQVKAMAKAVADKYGKIDILVNSNGMYFSKPFLECTDEDWWNVMDTNLLTDIYAMWEVLPYMIEAKSGSVINIASKIGANRPNNEAAFHSFANGALVHVSKCINMDMAKEGIRVNCISAGITDDAIEAAPLWKNFIDPGVIPMGRTMKPEEVAGAAVYLASDEASFVSGALIEVDGGWVGGEHMTARDC